VGAMWEAVPRRARSPDAPPSARPRPFAADGRENPPRVPAVGSRSPRDQARIRNVLQGAREQGRRITFLVRTPLVILGTVLVLPGLTIFIYASFVDIDRIPYANLLSQVLVTTGAWLLVASMVPDDRIAPFVVCAWALLVFAALATNDVALQPENLATLQAWCGPEDARPGSAEGPTTWSCGAQAVLWATSMVDTIVGCYGLLRTASVLGAYCLGVAHPRHSRTVGIFVVRTGVLSFSLMLFVRASVYVSFRFRELESILTMCASVYVILLAAVALSPVGITRVHRWLAPRGEGAAAAAAIASLIGGSRTVDEMLAEGLRTMRGVPMDLLRREHLSAAKPRPRKVRKVASVLARASVRARQIPASALRASVSVLHRGASFGSGRLGHGREGTSTQSRSSADTSRSMPKSAPSSKPSCANCADGREPPRPARARGKNNSTFSSGSSQHPAQPVISCDGEGADLLVLPRCHAASRNQPQCSSCGSQRSWDGAGCGPEALAEAGMAGPGASASSLAVSTVADQASASNPQVWRPVEYGTIDAFISHSWSDDADAKWEALQEWRARFKARHRREPVIWFDRLSIDQSTIATSIELLPVYLAGCQSVVALAGETYLTRLWCVMELFVFVETGGDRITVLPIGQQARGATAAPAIASPAATGAPDHPGPAANQGPGGGPGVDMTPGSREWAETFDVRSARCTLLSDTDRLMSTIEAAFEDTDAFNRRVRGLLAGACPVDRGSTTMAARAAGLLTPSSVRRSPASGRRGGSMDAGSACTSWSPTGPGTPASPSRDRVTPLVRIARASRRSMESFSSLAAGWPLQRQSAQPRRDEVDDGDDEEEQAMFPAMTRGQ